MASATYVIDCAAPLSQNFFQLQDFVEFLNKKMKVNKLRNNLAGKVVIEADNKEKRVTITASVKYSKRACRYYARKFLKKNDLRDRFRVIATGKTTYELRPYRASAEE